MCAGAFWLAGFALEWERRVRARLSLSRFNIINTDDAALRRRAWLD